MSRNKKIVMWGKVSIFCLVLTGFVSTDNLSNCEINDITDDEWLSNFRRDFNDNLVEEIIFASEYSGTLDDINCMKHETYIPFTDYLDFHKNDTHFIIETTYDFRHFDKDVLAGDTNSTLLYECSFTCQDVNATSRLAVIMDANGYNNHAPEFRPVNTTYVVPSPIMAKTDFSIFGDLICATDADFNNINITFKTDPDHFTVTFFEDTRTIPTTFNAIFRAKQNLFISDPVTYTIIATDSGTLPGPRSSNIAVTLVLDENDIIPVPTFDSSYYNYQYNSDNTLTPLSGPINFKMTDNNPKFELTGDLKEHFSVFYDPMKSQVSLKLENNIEKPSAPYTILTLSYKADVEANASIIINFTTAPTSGSYSIGAHGLESVIYLNLFIYVYLILT